MVVPHAVESNFRFNGGRKHRQVACVGRWQDVVQKRPWLLMEVISSLLASDHEVLVVIVGHKTTELEKWHGTLPGTSRSRVTLAGKVDREELEAILGDSQIFYSSSAFESFGIAAAEALCSGCSVVAGRSVSMASFEWFVSEASGRLAERDDAAGHASALKAELEAWKRHERNPRDISSIWSERLHADQVARRILDLKR